jgi:hypothetical protein
MTLLMKQTQIEKRGYLVHSLVEQLNWACSLARAKDAPTMWLLEGLWHVATCEGHCEQEEGNC